MSRITAAINVPRQYGVSTYALAILGALQGRPVYQGTANRKAVAKRRAKNQRAKQSRKANRR